MVECPCVPTEKNSTSAEVEILRLAWFCDVLYSKNNKKCCEYLCYYRCNGK